MMSTTMKDIMLSETALYLINKNGPDVFTRAFANKMTTGLISSTRVANYL